jgi:hypothetical protein
MTDPADSSAPRPRQKVKRGLILGATSGFILSAVYTIIIVLLLAVPGLVHQMVNPPPWVSNPVAELFVSAPFLIAITSCVGAMIGIVPSTMIGAIGGAVIGLIHLWSSLATTLKRALLVGASCGISIILVFYYFLFFWQPAPLEDLSHEFVWTDALWFLLFPGLPSLLIVAASTWVSWKLYQESLSTLRAPPPPLPNDNRND